MPAAHALQPVATTSVPALMIPVGSSSESPLPVYDAHCQEQLDLPEPPRLPDPHELEEEEGGGGGRREKEGRRLPPMASGSEGSTASPESGSYPPNVNGSTGN